MKTQLPRQGKLVNGIWYNTAELEQNKHITKKTVHRLRKNNVAGINKHTKIPEVIPKKLTNLQKYQKACKINAEIKASKEKYVKAREEYRRIAQVIADKMTQLSKYLE